MLNVCECCRVLNGIAVDNVRFCSPEIKKDVGSHRWTKTSLPYDNCPNCVIGWRKTYYTVKKLIEKEKVIPMKRRFKDKHRNTRGHRDLMLKIGLVENFKTLDNWI